MCNNITEIYKCKICDREFSSAKGLSYHITHSHNISLEQYYLTYINHSKGICVVCGKPTSFMSIITGYQKTCGRSCGGKYGSAQGHLTTFNRYGKYALNNPIRNKQYYLEHPEAKEVAIIKQVAVRKANNSYKLGGLKAAQTRLQKITNFEAANNCTMVYSLVREYGQGWYKMRDTILCKDDYIIPDFETRIDSNINYFIKNDSIYKIRDYFNKMCLSQASYGEKSVVEFIKTFYTGDIVENDRSVIKPYELDIFIPEYNIAIEYNGTYWHSAQAGLDKYYHFNKSKLCEEAGIRLIHIYEYQWQDQVKQDILKSIIKNAFGKNEYKIYARNCVIKELTRADVLEFSNSNSLHAHRNASIYLGLFYNDQLVELMSFGHAYFSKDKSIDYECIRSITKLNTTVVGGMNKLFSYFIKKYNPQKILYYVDYNTHIGTSMANLNFKFISYSKGGIINVANDTEIALKYGTIFNRQPSKHKEIKSLEKEGRILTIYDAGVKKYIWENK